MKMRCKLYPQLNLSPIKEERGKSLLQLNAFNSKLSQHLINSKILINSQNGTNATLGLKSQRQLMKPIAFKYNKQLIDIYHIAPGKPLSKKQLSSTLYYCIKIHCDASRKQPQKYLLPISHTNYFKKEEIIPGPMKPRLNNSFSHNCAFHLRNRLSIQAKEQLMTSKSDLLFRMAKYKLKLK